LRKHAGHTMMWIANVASGTTPERFSAPLPGCCSLPEPFRAKLPPTPSDAMWTQLIEFEFEAGLGDLQFRSHEPSLKASRYGVIRFNFNRLRLKHRLRNLMLDDFIEVVGDYAESFELVRRYYHRTTLGPSEALPIDATPVDRDRLDPEIVLSGLLNAIFALAARGAETREVLEKWTASAAHARLATVVGPWIKFVEALFVSNTSNAEAAVRDQSLSWPW
jgi:hypothetical protein